MYLFDNTSFSNIFKFYYPKRFPTLWLHLEGVIKNGKVLSVATVYDELLKRFTFEKNFPDWLAKQLNAICLPPSAVETEFMQQQLFTAKNGHFQELIGRKHRSQNKPCADPFLIAKAKAQEKIVVTEEKHAGEGGFRIPNACQHFGITCINLEQFMEKEDWQF